MNKQSNLYTILYSTVLVVLVGAVLAVTYMALKPKQTDNIKADKMKQILYSVHITAPGNEVIKTYEKYITDSYVINEKGEKVEGESAFDVVMDMANEIKVPADKRKLPVFECTTENNGVKYIMPMYGAGLWGPIWGYISVDADGSTIYGAYFSHQGETPGLGAEIGKEAFQKQFDGKHLYIDGQFKSLSVLKTGQVPESNEESVNAISGGTITSKGVQAMLKASLEPYDVFFKNLRETSK